MRDFEAKEFLPEETNPFENLKWEEIKGAEYRRFQWGNEPEIIHIIKTGFEDQYMVIWEDAFELQLGNVDHLSKTEIESRFKIKL
jgi:hypothetical protein